MKKWIIIPIALIGLLLLILPGLIGAWLPGQIQQSLQNSWSNTTPLIQRGWFSTSVTAQSSTSRLSLDFQHLPWWRGAWLSGSGELEMTEPAMRVAVDGSLKLNGNLTLAASSDSIEWSSTEENRIERVEIALDIKRGQSLQLQANAQAMVFSDPLGNRIDLQNTRITSDWLPVSETLREWALQVDSSRPDQAESQLRLNAASVQAEGMANLLTSLLELIRTDSNSTQAQMAGLGLIGAWQQLVQAGLDINLNDLSLDQQIQLQGQWQPANSMFNMSGGGSIGTALDWMAPFIGLSRRLTPNQAREGAWQVLATAADANRLTIQNERFKMNDSR